MRYSAPIHIVVCGAGIVTINDNGNDKLSTPKVVNVYDLASLPVSPSDYFSYYLPTTDHDKCPITSVEIDNPDLYHDKVNRKIWRVTATEVKDYTFNIIVTAKGSLGSSDKVLTKTYGEPYVYSVVCPSNVLSDSGSVT